MVRNNNEIIHERFEKIITPDFICVDMTAGNGHDTLFLAQYSKHVYAIDIQEEAILKTKQRTKEYSNITYIKTNHQMIDQYITPYVDLIIYNLGYLPGGDKKIITIKESTIISLSKAHQLLKINSYLIVTCYPGHPKGLTETKAVTQWINHKIEKNQYQVEILDYPTKNSPITYICQKIKM